MTITAICDDGTIDWDKELIKTQILMNFQNIEYTHELARPEEPEDEIE